MNSFIVLLVIVFWMVDEGWIPSGSSGRTPLVTDRVVITLIAGSGAHLGAAAVSIARELFAAAR